MKRQKLSAQFAFGVVQDVYAANEGQLKADLCKNAKVLGTGRAVRSVLFEVLSATSAVGNARDVGTRPEQADAAVRAAVHLNGAMWVLEQIVQTEKQGKKHNKAWK